MAVNNASTAIFDSINAWLRRSIQTSIRINRAGATGLILLGLVLLLTTFLILYALSGLIFPTSDTLRIVLAVAGIIGAFVANSMFSQSLSSAVNQSAGLTGSGESKTDTQNTDSVQTFGRMLTTLLFCGPKAILFGLSMADKAKRMKRMDYPGCSAVLVLLLTRDSRLPYSEIKSRLSKLDTLTVFGQMEDIEGVLFLESDPPGLSLSENLRRELSMFKK